VPVDLTVQVFNAYLGTQEGVHSVILPDIFSSGGSKNVFIDKYARVVRINGYTKQNSSAVTTDTGGTATKVVGLIPYRSTSGGSITRELVGIFDDATDEWEIHLSTDNGATWTFKIDEGSTVVGQIPDWAQFGDNLFITNGKVAARIYDGSTFGTVALTQSPQVTAVINTATGNLTGNYTYKLLSTIVGVRQQGALASTSKLAVNEQMDLTWTADADTNVDGYEIYRTSGTGTVYFYLTTIDGRATTAFTDNLSDLTLLERRIMEEHGDAPPVSYFCEPHKQRMWWLRTDTNPTRGFWSDAGLPRSVYPENFLNFSDSETVGDTITGAIGNYEGLLVVFTEKAVWTVSGTGTVIGDIVDFTKIRTNAGTGAVSGRTVVRIPAGAIYTDPKGEYQTTAVSSLAYLTPLGDIRLFDGDNDIIISHPIRETVKALSFANKEKSHAIIDSANDQAIWIFPKDSAGEPDTAVVWNYRFGVFYPWETMPFSSSVELDTSTDAATMLVGESLTSKGGFVYELFKGNSFDGSNIDSQWMTKTLYGVNEEGQPALSNRKRWRWLDVLFRVDQDINVTVEWLTGASPDTGAAVGSTTITPNAASILSVDGSTIISNDGSTLLVALASAQEKAFLRDGNNDFLHDEGIRLRIGSDNTSGPWALEAMQLAYQMLPGLKRRDQ